MGAPRQPSDPLRSALARLARADAPGLLEDARTGARARARALLEDALVEELLNAATELTTEAVPGEARQARPTGKARPPREAVPVELGAEANSGETPAGESRGGSTRDGGAVAWWVYCVLRARDSDALPPDLEGVEPGSSVELLGDGELAAVVSQVPLADYDDEQLRAHLNDIEWVERTARAHEAVLDHMLPQATIVPLRLCTLYREQDGIRRLLREQRATLLESLALVDERAEWGVKLFADRDQVTANLSEEIRAEQSEPVSAGTGYLARRQRERVLSRQADDFGARCAGQIHAELESIAVQARANPLQPPEAHGRAAEMLLNAAYLVENERETALREAVARIRATIDVPGMQLELTGPWPPYNFVSTSAGVAS